MLMPKSPREKIASRCVHFNGLMNKTCKAGIVYDEIDKDNRMLYRAKLPCHKPDKYLPEGESQCHCPSLEFPSKEQIEKELKEDEERTNKIILAMEAVKPIRKEHKGKDWTGTITCPVCQGELHVSHAKYNGHIMAQCETDDCVRWIE